MVGLCASHRRRAPTVLREDGVVGEDLLQHAGVRVPLPLNLQQRRQHRGVHIPGTLVHFSSHTPETQTVHSVGSNHRQFHRQHGLAGETRDLRAQIGNYIQTIEFLHAAS